MHQNHPSETGKLSFPHFRNARKLALRKIAVLFLSVAVKKVLSGGATIPIMQSCNPGAQKAVQVNVVYRTGFHAAFLYRSNKQISLQVKKRKGNARI